VIARGEVECDQADKYWCKKDNQMLCLKGRKGRAAENQTGTRTLRKSLPIFALGFSIRGEVVTPDVV